MSRTIEFETELTGSNTLALPPEIASALPSNGRATVVVFVDMDPDDAAWKKEAYEHFQSSSPEREQSDWQEFISRTYGSCSSLGLEEPEDSPLTSPPRTSPGRR